jgi:hypothetical protein
MEELFVTAAVYLFCFCVAGFVVWQHPNWKGLIAGTITLYIYVFMGIALVVGRYCVEGIGGAIFIPLWVLGGIPMSCAFSFAVRAARQEIVD